MSVGDILEQKKNNGLDCRFNGYLEEYLDVQNDDLSNDFLEVLKSILKEFPQIRICVDLQASINSSTISNQMIRYKDIFKLEGKPMVIPFFLYLEKGTKQRALLICDEPQYSYLYAKGLFYCLSEPESEFASCKNDIVAIGNDSEIDLVDLLHTMFDEKCGLLQRKLDHKFFQGYGNLKNDALLAANQLRLEAPLILEDLYDRKQKICFYVTHWFLLKKVLYVQYMVNKNLLNAHHGGDIRQQRAQAKKNADEIVFIPYSDLWRVGQTK